MASQRCCFNMANLRFIHSSDFSHHVLMSLFFVGLFSSCLISCGFNGGRYKMSPRIFFKTLKGSLNIRDAGHMLSGLDRILSVEPIFDIGEKIGEDVVRVMGMLYWALVEKSQALIFKQFFDKMRFQKVHLGSCILIEILPILGPKPFCRQSELLYRLLTLNRSPDHHGA